MIVCDDGSGGVVIDVRRCAKEVISHVYYCELHYSDCLQTVYSAYTTLLARAHLDCKYEVLF